MSYDHVLDDDEKRELLRIARATLREFLFSGRIPPGKPHRECLVRNAGAFVTLTRNGDLRGCIGKQAEDGPLYKTVQEMAVAAASRDPRFDPITEAELEELEIEVSVLGERSAITTAAEIEIGKHGLFLRRGARQGLLLPQVASENDWDATTFLAKVCGKAMLGDDAWSDPESSVETFTAQVFNDTTHPRLQGARR